MRRLVALGLVLAVTGCSATAGPNASSTPATTAAASPSPSPTMTPALAPSDSLPPYAEHADPSGDSKAGDFVKVAMAHSEDHFAVRWTMRKPVPTTGQFGLVLMVASADESVSRQINLKWLDGELIGNSIFDFDTTMNTNVDEKPTIDGNAVESVYSWHGTVGDLGETWQWYASSSDESVDLDYCPDQAAGGTSVWAEFPS